VKGQKTMSKAKKSQKEVITEISFFLVIPKNGLICFVSFTLYNQFRISDCAILTRPSGGYRLSYPIKKLANGKTIQCVYPINQKIAKEIEEIIFVNYEKFLLTKGRD
jgi:DNA-binding cell septation regulator SpoVG